MKRLFNFSKKIITVISRSKELNIVNKFNNLKFKHKLVAGFLAVILVFLISSGISLLFINGINNNAQVLETSGDNMYYVLKLATLIRAKYIDAVDLSNNESTAIRHFKKHEEEFQQVVERLDKVFTNKRTRMLFTELINQNKEFNRIFIEELIPVYKIKNGEEVSEYNGIVNFKVPMIAIVNTRDDLIYASNTLNKIFIDRRKGAIKRLNGNIHFSYSSSIIALIITIVIAIMIVAILEKNLVNTLQKLVDYSN